MARSFTVTQLLARARQRADMEGSEFVTDSELKGILSTAYGELYSMLVESGCRYFESTQSITTDGTASYSLSSVFLSTIRVDRVFDSGRRHALPMLMAQEANLYSGGGGAGQAHAWALTGSNIALYPTPPSGQDYEHIYVPQPTDLSSADGVDAVDVVTPDGEAFIDAYLQVEMLAKEESDVGGAIAKRERSRERVQWWATQRALTEAKRATVSSYDPGGQGAGEWWFR